MRASGFTSPIFVESIIMSNYSLIPTSSHFSSVFPSFLSGSHKGHHLDRDTYIESERTIHDIHLELFLPELCTSYIFRNRSLYMLIRTPYLKLGTPLLLVPSQF